MTEKIKEMIRELRQIEEIGEKYKKDTRLLAELLLLLHQDLEEIKELLNKMLQPYIKWQTDIKGKPGDTIHTFKIEE